jgi:hypothetical protein
VYTQKGNFLLQALLALTLVFAFIPFFSRRIATRDVGAQMYATTHQVETARTASRIFIQENADSLPYNQTIISGERFGEILEPYGLPLGFVARTALGQDISLIIDKNTDEISAFIRLSGGKLSVMQRAELAHRIGFYAIYDPEDVNGDIDIGVQLGDMYSDVVRRNDKNSDLSGFLTDLDMGGFRLDNIGNVLAMNAKFDTGEITTLAIYGTEAGRKERNNIASIKSDKTVFQSASGESGLSLTRGTLNADTVVGRTVAKYGDTGNITVVDASVDTFDMSIGHAGFTGPEKWDVGGNVITSRISFSLERLDVASSVNVSRGQDVYIDTSTLTYSNASGIDTDYIYSSNITLRDQTSDSLNRGGSGVAILDIRPGGTSLLPDALVNSLDNSAFSIIANAADDDDKTVDCRSIISEIGSTYNSKSLAQYIICQYVFWQRLEHRINIKQCLMGGGSACK